MGKRKKESRSKSPRRKHRKRSHSREHRRQSHSPSTEKEWKDSSSVSGHSKKRYRQDSRSMSRGNSRSPKHHSRSGSLDRRYGRSRSRSKERRLKRSRSRSYDRRRGKSRKSRSRSHDRKGSRSRGQSKSRSRSYDRRRGRSRSRRRSRSHGRSYDRRHDRSRSRRRNRSRSKSYDRRSWRSRSRSHDRTHSRRHSDRRHGYSRSASRDRTSRPSGGHLVRDRRNRGSESSSESDDKSSRSDSQNRETRRRGMKVSDHRNGGYPETPTEDQSKKKKNSLAKEIPGYEKMTPAERVRAKMKAMLDKSTASLSKAKDKEEPAVYVPTPAQREMLESESFEAAKFVSNRTTSKDGVGNESGSTRAVSDIQSVDPSEYEPQVVELPLPVVTKDEDGVKKAKMESEALGNGESSKNPLDWSEEERKKRWILKLAKMREKFLASMTEEEREEFFKSLAV